MNQREELIVDTLKQKGPCTMDGLLYALMVEQDRRSETKKIIRSLLRRHWIGVTTDWLLFVPAD
ncbi:hypothetical protein KJ885_01395 [Patescibacteria group bacterium]|nr:hypothetical protein [Patescibacteria group bacterium]